MERLRSLVRWVGVMCEGGREVAPHAFYNLGNARLTMNDVSGAIQAYKQALVSVLHSEVFS